MHGIQTFGIGILLLSICPWNNSGNESPAALILCSSVSVFEASIAYIFYNVICVAWGM
jgi:hypothetical protein